MAMVRGPVGCQLKGVAATGREADHRLQPVRLPDSSPPWAVASQADWGCRAHRRSDQQMRNPLDVDANPQATDSRLRSDIRRIDQDKWFVPPVDPCFEETPIQQ